MFDGRPSELDVIRSGSQRPRQNSNILDAIVGKEQPILAIDGAAAVRSPFYEFKHQIAVLRMTAFHDHVKRYRGRWIVFEDTVGFIRPDMLSAARSPTKTPCVTQPLGFRQIGFAAPELPRQQLVLCNIDAYANSLQTARFRGCRPNTTDVSELAVRTYDTFRDVKPESLPKHLIHGRSHEFTIVGWTSAKYTSEVGASGVGSRP